MARTILFDEAVKKLLKKYPDAEIFKEAECEHMLVGDILVADWTGQIPQAAVTIVIVEGLLMYFSKEQLLGRDEKVHACGKNRQCIG